MIKLRLIIIIPWYQFIFKFSVANCGQSSTHVVDIWFRALLSHMIDLVLFHGLFVVLLLFFQLELTFVLVIGFLHLQHQVLKISLSFVNFGSDLDELRLVDLFTLIVLYIGPTIIVSTYALECLDTSSSVGERTTDYHADSQGILLSSVVNTTNTVVFTDKIDRVYAT